MTEEKLMRWERVLKKSENCRIYFPSDVERTFAYIWYRQDTQAFTVEFCEFGASMYPSPAYSTLKKAIDRVRRLSGYYTDSTYFNTAILINAIEGKQEIDEE